MWGEGNDENVVVIIKQPTINFLFNDNRNIHDHICFFLAHCALCFSYIFSFEPVIKPQVYSVNKQ